MSKGQIQEVQEECLLGARFLWQELRDVWGHVSCRLPNGEGFVLKLVRLPLDASIDPDEIRVFDYEGVQVAGYPGVPGEIALHTEIFRTRPDVHSVVHAHPHATTALTTADKTVFAITQQSSQFGAGLPVFRGNFIDSKEIGRELAAALGDGPAVLMKGHGVVTVGQNVPAAVSCCLYVEQAAKQQIWASTLGTPELLPQELRDYRFPAEITGAEDGHQGGRGGDATRGGGAYLWRQLAWEWASGRAPAHSEPFSSFH